MPVTQDLQEAGCSIEMFSEQGSAGSRTGTLGTDHDSMQDGNTLSC